MLMLGGGVGTSVAAIPRRQRSLHAPSDRPYGDRMAGVTDPWGNDWFIATYLGGR